MNPLPLLALLVPCALCAACALPPPDAPARAAAPVTVVEVGAGAPIEDLPSPEPPPARVALPPLEELSDDPPGTSRGALAAAIEASLPASNEAASPVEIERVHVWRPEHGAELLVWSGCRADGEARACAFAIGKRGGPALAEEHAAAVRVLHAEPSGWQAADVVEGENRAEIRLSGSDDQGDWERPLTFRFGSGRGGVRLGAPTHFDPAGCDN